MNRKWVYKTISLIAGVLGILAVVYVVFVFMGSKPDSAVAILPGIMAVIALPVAYITNKLGRR